MSQSVNESLSNFFTLSIGTITVGHLLQAVVALVVCVFLARFVIRYADRALTRIHVERSLHTFVKSALNILLYTVAALIIADSLGIPITSLVAIVSVAGLAVSLSVQNTLMNLMGGLLLLTTKPFIVGDYVKAGDAEGTVVDIGLIYTQLATPDDKIIFAPNGTISSALIMNYTKSRRRRLDLDFFADFEADPEVVKPLIMKALEDKRVLDDPPPLVRVGGYGETGVKYAVRAWVETGDYWPVLYDVNERVGRAFREAGVRMPGRLVEVSLRKNDSNS